MKKIALLFVGFLVFGLFPVQVIAQENELDQETVQISSESEEGETTGSTQGNSNRQERLNKYKERLAERVTFVEQRVIRNSCKGAQNVLGRLNQNANQVKTVRENAYSSISDKLTRLSAKLTEAGIDSSSLDEVTSAMNDEVDIFLATLEEYLIILDDLANMDCESDPEAFKAALTAAKQQRVTLISSSQGLRNYFNSVIKPELTNLRQELVGNSEGGRLNGRE